MREYKSIMKLCIDMYRKELKAGRVTSPIRGLAEMYQRCVSELLEADNKADASKLKNLTIGDIDPTTFEVDGSKTLADRLGTKPWGTIHEKKEKFKSLVAKDFWDRRMPLTRYQADALGLVSLREQFASFISKYGLSYSADQTIIVPGSMPGIHMLFEALRDLGKKAGQRTELVAPTPGFSVYYSQAQQLEIDVVLVPGDPDYGFLPSSGKLEEKLGKKRKVFSIFYLTPANNPTSTVYSGDALRMCMDTFRKLRPNGYILFDLAYIEMIDTYQASSLLHAAVNDPEKSIIALSMSKIFGVPRLRSAALMTVNRQVYLALKSQSQLEYASESFGMALEALALWKCVSARVREEMFMLFRYRQDRLIDLFSELNKNTGTRFFTGKFFRDVPLYIYAEIVPGSDVLDVFSHTGMLGVPGSVFGDVTERWVRFSVGLTPFP